MISSDQEPMLGHGSVDATINKSFAHAKVKMLSIAELVLACISFVAGIGFIVIGILQNQNHYYYYCGNINPAFMAPGIWCGLLYGAAAIVGLKAAKHRSTCLIVTLMVLAITGAVFAGFQLLVSILGAAGCSSGYFRFLMLAFNILLAVIGLVQMILLIYSSTLTCCSTCCDQSPDYLAEIIEKRQPRPEPVHAQQPQPMVHGGQIMYAQSGSGSGMKPFLLVPLNPPGVAPNVQPAVGQMFYPTPHAVVQNVAEPNIKDQDDQPLIQA
uniref:Uncharacterized protein LOC100187041 n=1 Tax=Phallusia mammillata TaxID=59560 RepID=A0A6F9DHZ5_9ASCI|nr:uncharacterized protein LOC100187041 [Phallusia mammillata]